MKTRDRMPVIILAGAIRSLAVDAPMKKAGE